MHLLPLVIALLAAACMPAWAERTSAAIRADYLAVRSQLLAPDTRHDREKVEGSGLLERAFALVGEWVAAGLRTHLAATTDELVGTVAALNPADPGPPCESEEEDDISPFFCNLERFLIQAEGLKLGTDEHQAFALALSYAYWGRLLVITPNGVATSVPIDRRGTFHLLPDTTAGARRFYVDARSDDWPTSACGGGEFSLWQWDGREARAVIKEKYSDTGPDPGWGIHRHGPWLKIYTRDGLRTFGECCNCTDLKAVWKIRVDPDGVRDLGAHPVVREFGVIDELFYRTLHGKDVHDLAAPDVARQVAAALAGVERSDGSSDYLGMLGRWHRERRGDAVEFALREPVALIFTFIDRGGEPYATAVRPPDPKNGPM